MRSWLQLAVEASHDALTEDAEGYCLGRGLPEAILREIRVGQWVPPPEPCPDQDFVYRFGKHGESVADWIVFPVWAPSGGLLGVEFRRWRGEKAVMKHFMPASKWTPTFIGLSYSRFQRIADGSDVWLVEGSFDLSVGHVVAGVPLACGGAHLSKQQALFLSRFMRHGHTVYLCFDEDATGRGMSEGRYDSVGKFHAGAKQTLARVGVDVQVVRYRGGKDPGEIWDSGGRTALRAAFSNYIRN